MYCTNCGKELTNSETFCTQCGKRQNERRLVAENNDKFTLFKILGWIISVIGAIVAYINGKEYTSKSSEIQAWYYYRTELEASRTFLFVGLVVMIIGIAVLLFSYLKHKK